MEEGKIRHAFALKGRINAAKGKVSAGERHPLQNISRDALRASEKNDDNRK